MVHIRCKTPTRWTKNQKFWQKSEKIFLAFFGFLLTPAVSYGVYSSFWFWYFLMRSSISGRKIFQNSTINKNAELKVWKKVRFFSIFWLGWDHGGEPGGRYWYQTIGLWETYHPPTFHPPTSKDLDFLVKKPKNFPDFWHGRAPYPD